MSNENDLIPVRRTVIDETMRLLAGHAEAFQRLSVWAVKHRRSQLNRWAIGEYSRLQHTMRVIREFDPEHTIPAALAPTPVPGEPPEPTIPGPPRLPRGMRADALAPTLPKLPAVPPPPMSRNRKP